MRVGAIEETITVSGQTPLVDVQSVTDSTVFSDELLDAIPTVRLPQSYVPYLPGVQGAIIGAQHTQSNTLAIHGGRTGECLTAIDGSVTRFAWGGGGPGTSYYMMTAIIQDLSIELGGLTAEHQAGGIFANVIPKEGSNRFSGFLFASFTDGNLQGENLTDDLRARGLAAVPGNEAIWDVNPAVGGRILRDKLWFYSAFRRAVNNQYVAGEFYNKTPLAWTYTPDLDRPVINKNRDHEANTRLTWQVSQRNKLSGYLSIQPHYVYYRNLPRAPGPRVSPEATTYTTYYPNSFGQLVWKSPVSNRLLVEAAVARHSVDYNNLEPSDPAVPPGTWAALELTTNMRFRSIYPIGTNSGAIRAPPHHDLHRPHVDAYVTGSHAFKFGLDLLRGSYNETGMHSSGDVLVTLFNGAPRSLTLVANPLDNYQDVNADLGVFAQDRWTFKRLTMSGGLRFDYFNSGVPAQQLAAGLWVPARSYAAVSDVPSWSDVSPRFGAAYDLFGNGRTALKGFVGRYVAALGAINIAAANNPVNTSVTNVNRIWNDLNQDYIPDCDLRDPAANGECGRFSDVNFGKANSRASRYEQSLLRGYGKRSYNWEASASLQHQLGSRVSADLGYYRRWYGNFTLTDNVSINPADHDPFCIVSPVDARLPGGGGQQICGLYDLNPSRFGQVDNLITLSEPFGRQREVFDGVDLTLNARFGAGGQLKVGSARAGRERRGVSSSTRRRNCDSVMSGRRSRRRSSSWALIPFPGGDCRSAAFCRASRDLRCRPSTSQATPKSSRRSTAICRQA